jgi:hypothetical protein
MANSKIFTFITIPWILFDLSKQKPDCPFGQATRLSPRDPRLSVPASQRVWLDWLGPTSVKQHPPSLLEHLNMGFEAYDKDIEHDVHKMVWARKALN